MGEFTAMKLKRKELEEVNDDFSEFSLSSPATKIRRLDAELTPIMEEEEMSNPFVSQPQQFPMWQVRNSGLTIEELPTEPENEERALVLFKPMNSALIGSPSSFSVSVDPDLLSRINHKIWSSKSAPIELPEDESAENSNTRDECLAVVPWAPSKIPSAPEIEVSELMDADDMGVTSMDIEEENASVDHVSLVYNNSVPNPSQGFHQWQQQHCFIPQVSQNTSSPIISFR